MNLIASLKLNKYVFINLKLNIIVTLYVENMM